MKVVDKILNFWLIRYCLLKNLILYLIMNFRVIDNIDYLNIFIRKNYFCRRKWIYCLKYLGFFYF